MIFVIFDKNKQKLIKKLTKFTKLTKIGPFDKKFRKILQKEIKKVRNRDFNPKNSSFSQKEWL